MRFLIDYTMNFYYLPEELKRALNNLNANYLTEIRLRVGQPVIIQYRGEYKYINEYGDTDSLRGAIICESAEKVLYAAMEKSVYAYSEQLKNGFVTVDGGVRIGVAGEYVTQGANVVTVKNVTSLNIRVPHDVFGVAEQLYKIISVDGLESTLIFSPPGFGKTTILRDFARTISRSDNLNILLFDERFEISGLDGSGRGFELGKNCDVVRGADKYNAFVNSIRVMRPHVLITDELFGVNDVNAVRYAAECGITVIASSHSIDRNLLKDMPFEKYVELTGIGKEAVVYDKNFNFICNCSTVGRVGNGGIG